VLGRLWRLLALVCLTAGAVTGCGGSSDTQRPRQVTAGVAGTPGTRTISAFCVQISVRKRLATRSPALASLLLRNTDVSNFTGTSASQCNERELVYFGVPPAIPGQDQKSLLVRLTFFGDQAAASQDVVGGKPSSPIVKVAGTSVSLFSSSGLAGGSFVLSRTVVTLTLGCVDAKQDYVPTSCSNPSVRPASQRSAILGLSASLISQLRRTLA